MEARLGEPSLAQVELALAREKSVAQKWPGCLKATALHHLTGSGKEHLGDEIGVAHEVDVLPGHVDVGDRSVCSGGRLEDPIWSIAAGQQRKDDPDP
ncbi:unannotated protein [freshwater metagenome]|uniref:Unannotated protein n=1 Tax=freshwater metagenome TaxID=449393 RepID=A0A6J7C2L7_9ZZZZ